MITLAQVRQALASTIQTSVQTPVYVYSTMQLQGMLPAALIEPEVADFAVSMGAGTQAWEFNIWVLAPAVDPVSGQLVLDGLVTGKGPNSIVDAINSSPDLGLGDNVDSLCYAMHGYGGHFDWYATAHIGAVLRVRVEISN